MLPLLKAHLALKHTVFLLNLVKRANGGTRTRDILIGNQTLYQLSYIRIEGSTLCIQASPTTANPFILAWHF